ncbi:MAG: HEAT repeat domain-containing protein [Anaerolineae bacterium]|nr:HEAT repeat domain-containing protein [Anaerolineae bacterium]
MTANPRLNQWLEVLREPDAEMSKIAADKLGDLGSREAVADLITAMERRTAFVAAAAALALGKIGDPLAIPVLLQTLEAHQDVQVKAAAAEALGLLRAKNAVTALKKVVQDYLDTYRNDHFSRTRSYQRGLFTAAIAALKHIGTREAIRFAENAESYSRSL